MDLRLLIKHLTENVHAVAVVAGVTHCKYYRHFVPKFALIAAPMHALTKKNVLFQWTDECESEISAVNNTIYPIFGLGCSFILETDANTMDLGALNSQIQGDGTIHPIAYTSA